MVNDHRSTVGMGSQWPGPVAAPFLRRLRICLLADQNSATRVIANGGDLKRRLTGWTRVPLAAMISLDVLNLLRRAGDRQLSLYRRGVAQPG